MTKQWLIMTRQWITMTRQLTMTGSGAARTRRWALMVRPVWAQCPQPHLTYCCPELLTATLSPPPPQTLGRMGGGGVCLVLNPEVWSLAVG
jgi:hypothetical protein